MALYVARMDSRLVRVVGIINQTDMIPGVQIGDVVAMYFDFYDPSSGFLGQVTDVDETKATVSALGSSWWFYVKYGELTRNYIKYDHVYLDGMYAQYRRPTVIKTEDPVAFLVAWSKGKFIY